MVDKNIAGYSIIQIALHWLIVVAVLFQLVFGESMTNVADALEEGATPEELATFNFHQLISGWVSPSLRYW